MPPSLKFVIIYDNHTRMHSVEKYVRVRGRWLREGPPVFWSNMDGALEHIRKESM